MKDQLQQLGRKLLENADRTVTAILGLLFLAMVGLLMNELSRGEAELPPPPPNPFLELLPNEKYDKVVENYINVNQDISKDPEVNPLIEFNMFDLKSVKQQEELAKQLDGQVDQAEQLFQAGRKEEALKLLDDVLARKPDHVRALDLRNQIVPQPTPTPTPTS